MQLPIIEIGNPLLRQIAIEVLVEEISSEEVQHFIDDLIETKRLANGAGLAAPQVSKLWRIFVVEVQDNPRYPYKPNYPLTVVINPRIFFLTEDRYDSYEGCLSVPDLRGVLPRCPEIRVTGYNRFGNPLDRIVLGISAATFQHENDHLNGILFPDKVSDTQTFCTNQEFLKHYEEGFRKTVERIVAQYGS